MKFCSKCKITKEIIEFNKNKKSRDGLSCWCKNCNSIYKKQYHKVNVDYCRKYRKENRERIQKYQKEYDLKKYNLTLEQKNEMLNKQNGCCAICKKPETAFNSKIKTIKSLAVDHNHKNGKVRGLLCGNCNIGIGKLKEDIQILKNAIQYIEVNND